VAFESKTFYLEVMNLIVWIWHDLLIWLNYSRTDLKNGKTFVILNDVTPEVAERIAASPLVEYFEQSQEVHLDDIDHIVEGVLEYGKTDSRSKVVA